MSAAPLNRYAHLAFNIHGPRNLTLEAVQQFTHERTKGWVLRAEPSRKNKSNNVNTRNPTQTAKDADIRQTD
jgi:hypothetical protein